VNEIQGVAYLDVPQSPKKAFTVSEKPIRPKPYALNGASTSTMLIHYQDSTPHAPKQAPPKPKMNDNALAFAVPFAIAIVLAIVIPLAAILPQKYIQPLPVNVLMPFYIDPIQGSWDRLYDTYVSNVKPNVE
jgi:hypothetical protein